VRRRRGWQRTHGRARRHSRFDHDDRGADDHTGHFTVVERGARDDHADVSRSRAQTHGMSVTASDAVRLDWQRRVAAEYSVSAFAQDFAHRLTMFGAPPDLIEQALVTALDELAHARLAADVCAAAEATGAVVYDPEAFYDFHAEDPAEDIAVAAVPSLCLGEMLALRLQHHLREGATVPVACAAIDRVLDDEPRHAALGWTTLDWLLDLPQGDDVGDAVERALPGWVDAIRASFAGDRPEPHLIDITDADRAWGLAPANEFKAIFETTVERDWTPRLARRGFTL
jgi:hypothetical protein